MEEQNWGDSGDLSKRLSSSSRDLRQFFNLRKNRNRSQELQEFGSYRI